MRSRSKVDGAPRHGWLSKDLGQESAIECPGVVTKEVTARQSIGNDIFACLWNWTIRAQQLSSTPKKPVEELKEKLSSNL